MEKIKTFAVFCVLSQKKPRVFTGKVFRSTKIDFIVICKKSRTDFLLVSLFLLQFNQYRQKFSTKYSVWFHTVYLICLFCCFSRAHKLVETAGKMSCARPSNFTLRRQKSLGCDCQPIVSTRERRLRLQKQYSVDQNRDNTASANVHRSTNNVHNVLKNGTGVNTLWNCNNPSPEASLRIFTAIKTKSQNHACETNEECVSKREKQFASFVSFIFHFFEHVMRKPSYCSRVVFLFIFFIQIFSKYFPSAFFHQRMCLLISTLP